MFSPAGFQSFQRVRSARRKRLVGFFFFCIFPLRGSTQADITLGFLRRRYIFSDKQLRGFKPESSASDLLSCPHLSPHSAQFRRLSGVQLGRVCLGSCRRVHLLPYVSCLCCCSRHSLADLVQPLWLVAASTTTLALCLWLWTAKHRQTSVYVIKKINKELHYGQ